MGKISKAAPIIAGWLKVKLCEDWHRACGFKVLRSKIIGPPKWTYTLKTDMSWRRLLSSPLKMVPFLRGTWYPDTRIFFLAVEPHVFVVRFRSKLHLEVAKSFGVFWAHKKMSQVLQNKQRLQGITDSLSTKSSNILKNQYSFHLHLVFGVFSQNLSPLRFGPARESRPEAINDGVLHSVVNLRNFQN